MSDRFASLSLGTNDRRGPCNMAARYANRHGLITGATGSGKTWSLVRLASEFNRIGVPVFAPDMKGDLADIIARGIPNCVAARRLVPGVNFHLNMREVGGDLMARAMGLSDAQRGVLDTELAAGACTPFQVRALAVSTGVPAATMRPLLRGLDRLDARNFGPNGFDVADLIATPAPVTVLHARDIAEQGATYAATIAYMLRDLYTRLPEVGDRATPVLAFFVDEAHMLFNGAPADLVAEIERMVRLIRSRGVSLWFVTQSPADLPDGILAQLQNRVQHSLRAVTPKDWRGVRAAIDTMPPGDFLDPVATLGKLPPGQAMVSLVGRNGQPRATELCRVAAPDWCPAEMAEPDAIGATLAQFVAPTAPSPTPIPKAFRRRAKDKAAGEAAMRFGKLLATIAGTLAGILVTLAVCSVTAFCRSGKRHGRRH